MRVQGNLLSNEDLTFTMLLSPGGFVEVAGAQVDRAQI